MVDIARAQPFRNTIQQMQLFQCRRRRCQHAELIGILLRDIRQQFRRRLQGIVPARFLPLAAGLDHRFQQSLFAVNAFITEAIAIRQPGFIDLFVLARYHAHELAAQGVSIQVGAGSIVRRDHRMLQHFPAAATHAERLGIQRTDRAKIDHIAG